MNYDDLAHSAAHIDKQRGIGGKFSINNDHNKVTFLYSGCEYIFSLEKTLGENHTMTVTQRNPWSLHLLWEIGKHDTAMRFRAFLVFLEDKAGTYRLEPILTSSNSEVQALAA